MTDSSYQTAHLIYTKAVITLDEARTTYTVSVKAHKEAVAEAARLELECECATQSAHAVAWADANADNDANAAAWAQAHRIDCVVDHIAEADCSFGPAPGLTQPTLCDDIESVSCAAESGSAAPTVVSESVFDLGTEAWPPGFCMPSGTYTTDECCPAGYNVAGITSESECKTAFESISDDRWGGNAPRSTRPSGCFLHMGNNNGHWN